MKKRVTRSIVPNLLTLGNLFAGFSAIVYIANDDFVRAALFILMAAIFDMLDGVMARLFKATSEFGAELDSLCDAVSFGVAPGYMLYKVYFESIGEIGILLASLPALAGVVRLARFNVKLNSFDDKLYFHGLPIPSSALTIISYIVFFHLKDIVPLDLKPAGIIAVTLLTSLAMVSRIRFDNLPRPTKKSFQQRPYVLILFVIGFVVSILTNGLFIFPFMMFYIIASSIRELYFWFKESREPEDEIDESQETEPSGFDI